MNKFLLIGLLVGFAQISSNSFAADCTDFNGKYDSEAYYIRMIQKGCESVIVDDEFGAETLIIDGVQHSQTDYNDNVLLSKIAWNEAKTEIIVTKDAIIRGESVAFTEETYSLTEAGDLKLTSVDRLGGGSPQTLTYIFTRATKH